MAHRFGESIKDLREKRGLTQRGLAKRAHTSQSAIARIEAGTIDPRVSTLDRILNTLNGCLLIDCDIEQPAVSSYRNGDGEDECSLAGGYGQR